MYHFLNFLYILLWGKCHLLFPAGRFFPHYAAIQRKPEMNAWKSKALHFAEKLPDSIFKADLWLNLALALKDEICLSKAKDYTIMLQRPFSTKGQQLMDRCEVVRRFLTGIHHTH